MDQGMEWNRLSDAKRAELKRTKRREQAFKTQLCRQFTRDGFCLYGEECSFAHAMEELRMKPVHPRYKSELCRNYNATGSCPYGARCQFIHRSPPRQPQDLPSEPQPFTPIEDHHRFFSFSYAPQQPSMGALFRCEHSKPPGNFVKSQPIGSLQQQDDQVASLVRLLECLALMDRQENGEEGK